MDRFFTIRSVLYTKSHHNNLLKIRQISILISIADAPRLPSLEPVEVVEGTSAVINLTAAANPADVTYTWTGPRGRVINNRYVTIHYNHLLPIVLEE